MNAIIQSFLLVAASEMGDKTQLLALMLASRYRKPWTILLGIFVATLLNHALASWAGGWLSGLFSTETLRWALGIAFLGFAAWILVPDSDEELQDTSHRGAFFATLVSFFLAEMGDKTQLATLALGAKYNNPLLVTIGTTAGMILSDGLAVFFGRKLTDRIPLDWIRRGTAVLFAAFGLWILLRG